MSQKNETSSGVYRDPAFLLKRIAELEAEVARLKEPHEPKTAELDLSGDDSLQELGEARKRLEKIEEENREFASMYVQAQEQNEALSNLYVASQKLHATLNPSEVEKILCDILIEMVGAEDFGILLMDPQKKLLKLLAGEGVKDRLPSSSIAIGEGVIGDVATTGEPFFFEPKSVSERRAQLPLATIPLKFNEKTVGVIVIYKLLSHKQGFTTIDHQLLELVARDAATALVSARLQSTLGRKLRTIEGFMQLMKAEKR